MRETIPALVLLFATSTAQAAFVNGVEEFPGMVKDTATWEEFVFLGTGSAAITQNDSLTITTTGNGQADYTTVAQTAGVGQTARVEVSTTSNSGFISLFLTNNSGGSGSSVLQDSSWLQMTLDVASQNLEFGVRRLGSTTSGAIFDMSFDATSFLLEIERTASGSAEFRALETDGTLISSITGNFFSVPDELFIALHARGDGVATFDDVVVPEPGTASLLGLGLGAVGCRRLAGRSRVATRSRSRPRRC